MSRRFRILFFLALQFILRLKAFISKKHSFQEVPFIANFLEQNHAIDTNILLSVHNETETDLEESSSAERLSNYIFPFSFAGTWKIVKESNTPNPYFSLERKSGKMMFNFNRGYSKNSQLIWYEIPDMRPDPNIYFMQMILIDGDFHDDKAHFFDFPWISLDPSRNIFQIPRNSPVMDLTLQVDLSEIWIYDNKTGKNSFNENGPLKITMNFGHFYLEAELQKDTRDYNTTFFSIFFRVVMIFTTLTNIKLLRKLYPFSLESNKTFIFTPSCTATWDLIFLLNIYIAPRSGLLFFTEIAFYEISPSLLLILPVLRMAHGLVGRNLPMNEVHWKVCTTFILPIFISFFFLIFSIRIFFNNTFFFLTNLYLVPQIIHNIIKGAPVSFSLSHIACIISLRPLFPIYLRGYSDNIFQVWTSIPFTIGIVMSLVLQVLILYLQSKYGARFFIPQRIIPNNYNYFRNSSVSSQGTELMRMTKVCYICMEGLSEVPAEEAILDLEAKSMMKRMNFDIGKVIKTECKHKFHAICLLEWMMIKMECPKCGHKLKPIE